MATNDPASITDALIHPYLNHAASMYEEKYATREDIDNGMRFGCGLPVGPLALADRIGIDVLRDALAERHAQTGDPLHAPNPVLERLVAEGRTGQQAGRGFYTYAAAGSDEVVPDDETPTDAAAGADVRTVETVGVVGSGTMATGIVEVFAKAGFPVVVIARSQEKVDGVRAKIEKNLGKAVAKGRMEQAAADETLARVTGATEREALADVDLVVEAIAEQLDLKTELYRDLDRICKDGAILATTTSSLPIKDLAAVTQRPQDVIGMHFFNPAPVMKLVEVIHTDETGEDVKATVHDLCRRTKKVAVSCADRSGFIVNALLFPYLNDAILLVDSGAATQDEVDEAITSTYGYPMGPFALLDVVGLDVSLAIQEELKAEFGYEGFEPAPRLRELVAAGHLGRKTGQGFKTY